MAITQTIEDNYAHKIYDAWQQKPKGKQWTYIEVLHLAQHFTKLCSQNSVDYAEYDLPNMLDVNLTYYENLALLEEQLGNQEQHEAELYSKWMEESKEAPNVEKENESLTHKNRRLEAKLQQALEDSKISEAKYEATEKELANLKLKQQAQLAENFLVPPAPKVEKVYVQYSDTEKAELIEAMDLLAKKHKGKLAKTFSLLRRIYRVIKWILY